MSEEYRNIYQTARKAAGFTQEAAAERLGISTESIRAYENGYRIPSNEVVDLMATCYNAQYLGIQHLRTTNTIAARFVPVITERSLLQVAVQIHVRMSKFDNEQKTERLLAMAEDGHIDESERSEYESILADLAEIFQGYFALLCLPEAQD